MKIQLKPTKENFEILEALASKDGDKCFNAQVAIAEALTEPINKQYGQASVLSDLFQTLTYNPKTYPVIKIDLYADVDDGELIKVWSQNTSGGLPTNELKLPTEEMRVMTKKLTTALSMSKEYAAQGQLQAVPRLFEQMTQQNINEDNTYAMNLIVGSVVGAETKGKKHIMSSTQPGKLTMDDFNNLITYSKRLYSSWIGGTPTGMNRRGVTDMITSPEMIAKLRTFAYNPINTATAPMEGAVKNGVVAPDAFRAQLYNAAGSYSFFGINLIEYLEFGLNQKFNKIFGKLYGSETDPSFDPATQEAILCVDRSVRSLYRMVAVGENGYELTFDVDDQFKKRDGMIGWYGEKTEGKICLDDRALCALIV